LAIVNKQLASLSPEQRLGEDGLDLQDRAQSLRLLAGLNSGNVEVAQEAAAPTTPSSPKTSRNTELGVLLGLIVGLGLAFVLERLDVRIKGPDDLSEIYGVPLLGVVPESAALARAARKSSALSTVDTEAFNLIRAHLRFFNVDGGLRTLLVGSAAAGDGKTTIARYLAEAAARTGARVLLFEADLRQPTLSGQLGLQRGVGLSDVLTGAVSLEEATRSIDLGAAMGRGAPAHTLDILISGSMRPPNPSELTESDAMARLLERASSTYELVVIDTPPLTAVSDALSLLDKVDGVVIVGWVGRSRRDAAARLHQVLNSSHAHLLGVVANGAKSGAPVPYPSDESSSEDPALSDASPSAEPTPPVNV
jgi:capsular exopolysaccharide synthesis family protein